MNYFIIAFIFFVILSLVFLYTEMGKLRRVVADLNLKLNKEQHARISDSFKLNTCKQELFSLRKNYLVLADRYTALRQVNAAMRKDLLYSGIFVTKESK